MNQTFFLIFASVLGVSLVSLAGLAAISFSEMRIKKAMSFLIPLAVGALLGDAFLHLLPESFGNAADVRAPALFVLAGIVAFFALEKYLRWHHHPAEKILHEGEGDVLKTHHVHHLGPLVLVSDGFHNFLDGIIIAAGFLAGTEIGIATTVAVLLHEIPQEISDFGILLYAGYAKKKALVYNFISALTAMAGAVLVVFFGSLSEILAKIMIPLAAGMFLYVAAADLLPELHKNRTGREFAIEILGIALGIGLMFALLFIE